MFILAIKMSADIQVWRLNVSLLLKPYMYHVVISLHMLQTRLRVSLVVIYDECLLFSLNISTIMCTLSLHINLK